MGQVSRAQGYAELHCWSNFTFLEGGSHPEDLVERAHTLGLNALALTDKDGLYGAVRFTRAATAAGLPAICGAELTLHNGKENEEAHRPHVVLLVENELGYANLVQLISTGQMRGSKGAPRLQLDDFDGKTDGLIALSGGSNGILARPLMQADKTGALRRAALLRDCFPQRCYIELQHHLRSEDATLTADLLELAKLLGLPYVVTNGVAYANRDDGPLADILACIKHKTNLQEAGTLLRPNAEYYLKSPQQMARIFAPLPQALRNTLEIAERAQFRLDRRNGQFPTFTLPLGERDPQSYLCKLVAAGAQQRYDVPLPPRVERQIAHELAMIGKLDLAGYFLIVWDIVQAAERLGVLCQGRGSAANSVVCYVLRITAIDPIKHELLFERFLTEDRGEVPDIDIDFAHQDREKILQYVYERWGREHAAMAAEVITYRERSAIRDVGKALGLSFAQVDAIAKDFDARESLAGATGVGAPEPVEHAQRLPRAPASDRPLPLEPVLPAGVVQRRHLDPIPALHGFEGKNFAGQRDGHIRAAVDGVLAQRLFAFCRRIDGFPRHMGIHSGGMVITRDPLVRVAPIEWATMRDRTIVQWDKEDFNDLGLIKIDLLGLGMLSLLRDAFALHARAYGDSRVPLSLHTIPPDDRPTYAMLQKADSIGVFQVESRAQQSMLPRLRPKDFYDLVMQVAIIRPGPIQGDMIHPFLRRRNGLEPVTYPHPKLKPILERTLGVPLFQEQGMRMVMEAGGFSPSEADQLRRAMGHKRSHQRMAALYPKFVAGMVSNGIGRAAAEQLFHMIEGFADYGFPESHAASFALLAYISAYIKCHEPAVFAAAILNVQPMGFYSTEVLVNDARRHGVVIKPVTVNASELWSFVDESGALRLGYHLVRSVGDVQRDQLQRTLEGKPFHDLAEFAARTQLSKEVLENLAVADAFRPWYPSRREALWALKGLDERRASGHFSFEFREPAARLRPLSARETTEFDLWSTGVSPRTQPIAHFRRYLDDRDVIPAERLSALPKHMVCKVGGMVITRQRPGTAKGFVFLTLEDETGLVNIIVKPPVYERYRRVIRTAIALIIEGVLEKEDGCINLIARRFWTFATARTLTGMRSRNFH